MLAFVAWKERDVAGSRELLERARDARREEWKPEGAVAEGEVTRKMHTEATPLLHLFQDWDGTLDPPAAFARIDTHLNRLR